MALEPHGTPASCHSLADVLDVMIEMITDCSKSLRNVSSIEESARPLMATALSLGKIEQSANGQIIPQIVQSSLMRAVLSQDTPEDDRECKEWDERNGHKMADSPATMPENLRNLLGRDAPDYPQREA